MQKKLRDIVVVLIFVLACLSPASAEPQEYQPALGQEGKDVIWVPTPEALVGAMLDMARVTASDYLIDLGSGDGRIVIAAAKRGARALGIEYNPDMVELSKLNARKQGVSDKADFSCADLFETDFSRATVLTMYLFSDLNMRLRPRILEMKPGTRVVSHAFDMDDWAPDQTVQTESRTAYLWIVPAKAAGAWTWKSANGGARLQIRQTFQKIEGALILEGKESAIRDPKLEGDRISFAVVDDRSGRTEYSGRVQGATIEGSAKSAKGIETPWTAARSDAH